MKRVVDRSFIVRAPLETAWNHLAQLENWPSWAKHIRSVTVAPPGSLSRETRGIIRLANGVKSTFQMVEFEPLQYWKWRGSFLGSQVVYDHIFSRIDARLTRIHFTVDLSGVTASIVSGIFGRIYQKNLDRALPLLIREIESDAGLFAS